MSGQNTWPRCRREVPTKKWIAPRSYGSHEKSVAACLRHHTGTMRSPKDESPRLGRTAVRCRPVQARILGGNQRSNPATWVAN